MSGNNHYTLVTENGEPKVKLDLSEEDRKTVTKALLMWKGFLGPTVAPSNYDTMKHQVNIILLPERREALAVLLSIVEAIT
jgi:hypothetical protein